MFVLPVTSVRTARQVIDVLGAHGPDIDIILAEVDLPVAKGFKMLKYINRNKELRRIPIISELIVIYFFELLVLPVSYHLCLLSYALCVSQ